MLSARSARLWYVGTAVLVAAAVVGQFVIAVQGAVVLIPGYDPSVLVRIWRFFSYFTIQSNLLVIAGAVTLARDPGRDGPGWRVLRLCMLIGISVTGLVYATVLAPLVQFAGLAWWLNLGLHVVSPLLVVVGWVLWGPRPRITLPVIGWALLWPLAWLGYTLVVGAIRAWYPYPFLDVGRAGVTTVVVSCLGITVLFVLLAAAYGFADRRWPTDGARPEPTPGPVA